MNNEDGALFYYPDTKIVHHQLHRPIQDQPFREILNAGAELLEKHGAKKWLSDDRASYDNLPDESKAWAGTEWFPRMVKAGWRYWALVVPDTIEGRLFIKEFTDNYFDQGVWTMVFLNAEEALQWLENCDAS
ncbi:MAG: hypothetical protein KF770_23265 [Anaerolineae bacterium]|nr:hypothetical protein [Anaerolineae bacterium]